MPAVTARRHFSSLQAFATECEVTPKVSWEEDFETGDLACALSIALSELTGRDCIVSLSLYGMDVRVDPDTTPTILHYQGAIPYSVFDEITDSPKL